MNQLAYAGGDIVLYKTYVIDGRHIVESTALSDEEVKRLYELTRRPHG